VRDVTRPIIAALVAVLAAPAAAQHWTIADPGQGPVTVAAGAAGAHELSGLVWAGGERWAAVSDEDGHLYWLHLAVDPVSGRLTGGAVTGRLALAGSRDLEGIALAGDGTSVVVSDEVGPALREYALADGRLLRSAALPAVFATARANLGLESLTRDASGQFWTANEEALAADGPTSTTVDGTVVRLLRLDAALHPTGQWAYRTDPVAGAQVLDDRGTGLSDLAALPDGRLLALERSYGSEGLRIRLFEVDVDGATDVSRRPSLAGAEVVPARKQMLWQRTSASENFEGLALGPALAGGSRSLVLVSDDGHRLVQVLYPLSIRPAAPIPAEPLLPDDSRR
jgi:hypothetical protein